MTVDTIRTPDGGALAVPAGTPSVTSVVVEWATNMRACVDLAEQIVDTELVPIAYWPLPKGVKAKDVMPRLPLANEDPASYQGRRRIAVATTAGICYRGAELGMSWPQAVASVYIVGGRPSLYAEAMVGLVKARGHRIEVAERGRERCEIRTLRRGDADWQTFVYTIDDAVLAGYVPGKGVNVGGDSWKGNAKYNSDPAAMLYARCASTTCKTVYPDVLGGLEVAEIAADEQPVDITATVTVSQPQPSAADLTKAILDKPLPAADVSVPDPVARGQEPTDVPPVSKVKRARKTDPVVMPAASQEQIDRMVHLAGDLGLTTPEARRKYIEAHVDGFDPGVGLTGEQVAHVIAALVDDSRPAEASDAVENHDTPPAGEVAVDGLPDPADGDDPWAGQK